MFSTEQVGALYQALKEAGLTYINSVIDYGAAACQATQRTRLPRESLATNSANCIDGTVLMASLLEGASLNAALVLIPGHAFVGWQSWDGDGGLALPGDDHDRPGRLRLGLQIGPAAVSGVLPFLPQAATTAPAAGAEGTQYLADGVSRPRPQTIVPGPCWRNP
jgi:hypothetical protein